jgi:hypothetical protein
MSYSHHQTVTPVIQAFAHRHYDSGIRQSDATKEYNAAQREKNHAEDLLQQSIDLNDTIGQQQKELAQIHKNQGFAITQDMNANQDKILRDISLLNQQRREVDEKLPRAQNAVNERAVENEYRIRAQRQQVAAAAAAADDANNAAIAADRHGKLDKARDDYEKELKKYMDVVRYVREHKQKEWVGWAYSFLPSYPFGKKKPAWQLDEGDDENKIKEKYWLLHEEIQKYYEANPILKDISFDALRAVQPQPPRAKSPPPRGGKSRRRTKKGKGNGKGKNARPCRRSTCRRSTRRH